jgi:hypothetical protein
MYKKLCWPELCWYPTHSVLFFENRGMDGAPELAVNPKTL